MMHLDAKKALQAQREARAVASRTAREARVAQAAARRAAADAAAPEERDDATGGKPLLYERSFRKLALPRGRFRVSTETTDPAVYARRAGILDTLADATEAAMFFTDWQALPLKEKWRVTDVERVFHTVAKGDAETTIRVLRARKTFQLTWTKAIADFAAVERGRGIENVAKQTQHLETYAAFAKARTTSDSVRLGCEVTILTAFFAALGERGAKAVLQDDPALWEPVRSSTQERYRATFRKFLRFVAGATAGVVKPDVLRDVPTATGAAPEERYPQWTQAQRWAWLTATRTARVRVERNGRRTYQARPDIGLALRCLFYTGIDVGDLLRLTGRHFKRLSDGTWIVTPGLRKKTAKRVRHPAKLAVREIPLPQSLMNELLAHMASDALGITARKGRLFGCRVRELADANERCMRQIGVGGPEGATPDISVKDLRHVAPVQWLREGVDLHTIARRLGHTGLEQVHLYVRHNEGLPSARAVVAARATTEGEA